MRLLRLALASVALAAGAVPASSSAAPECPPNQLFNIELQPYVCLGYTWDHYGDQYYVVGSCAASPCTYYEIHLQRTFDQVYCRVPDAC